MTIMYFSSGKVRTLNCEIYFLTISYVFVEKQINNDFSNALTYMLVPNKIIFLSCMKIICNEVFNNNNSYFAICFPPVAYQLLKNYIIHCPHLNLACTEYHHVQLFAQGFFFVIFFIFSQVYLLTLFSFSDINKTLLYVKL